jgi:hypothetical protein
MKKVIIMVLAAALAFGAASGTLAAEKAFLWNGNHWKQASLDGKIGYVFGIGNLADFEVASGGSKGRGACISKAFVDELRNMTVMQIVQEVDKYYQGNPGKLSTPVIEVVLRRCTSVCPAEPASGAKKQ